MAAVLCALAAGLSLLAAGPASAVTAEEIIARHLEWQNATSNYRVELSSLGLKTGKIGTAFVDNTTIPPTVYFEGSLDFDTQSRTVRIVGTQGSTRAEIGQRAAQWSLTKTPFDRSFSLFPRDASVEEVMRRLHNACSEISVQENPVGGLVGIKLVFDQGFLGKVDTLLESVLLGGSVARNFDTTLWFNDEGRIERMVLNEGKNDTLITRLKYIEVNVPPDRVQSLRKTIDVSGKSELYPSFADMLQAIIREDRSGKDKSSR